MNRKITYDKEKLNGRISSACDLSVFFPAELAAWLMTVENGDYVRLKFESVYQVALLRLLSYYQSEVNQIIQHRSCSHDITDVFLVAQLFSQLLPEYYIDRGENLFLPLNMPLTDTGRTFFYYAGKFQRYMCDFVWPVDEANSHFERPDACFSIGCVLDTMTRQFPEDKEITHAFNEFNVGRFPDKYPGMVEQISMPVILGLSSLIDE